MSFQSLKEIAAAAAAQKKPFFRIILEDDMSERMVSEESPLQPCRKCMARCAMRTSHMMGK